MAFPAGWGRRVAVAVDNTKVGGTSGTLSDFPILVKESNLPSEIFDADGSNPAQNGGGDIRFSSDDGGATQLAIEVVSFVTNNNPALGTCEIWVKVPTLNKATDTTIYCWYDTSGSDTQPAVTDTFGRNNVWTEFEAVLHMVESAPDYVDSTGNGFDGKQATGSSQPTQTTTGHPFGGTWNDFDGTDDYFTLNGSDNILDESYGAVSAWVKVDSIGAANRGVLSNQTDVTETEYFLLTARDTNVRARVVDSTGSNTATGTALGTVNTQLLHMTWDASSVRLYNDGSEDATDTTIAGDNKFTSSFDVGVGGYFNFASGRVWNGKLGVVKISTNVRTADWILTEFNNENTASTFASAGTPETPEVAVTPGVGAVSIAGFAPTVVAAANVAVTPGVGAIDIAGFVPSIATPRNLNPGVGAIDIAGFAPGVELPQLFLPGVGTISILGYAPTVEAGEGVTALPGTGAIAIVGFAPTLSGIQIWTVVPEDTGTWAVQAEDSGTWSVQSEDTSTWTVQ